MNISGKKAIVFGGTSGIGLATVLDLVAKGAEVVAISRDPEKARKSGNLPDKVTLMSCDTTDAAAVEKLLAEVAPYDILVSAATGGSRAVGPFLEMDMEGYKGSFAKLWGYANVVRYGTQHLSEQGSIVLVSGAPARRCKPGQVAISSVGGSVEALVRAVAPEISPKRINLMSPGQIDTPMVAFEGDERKKFYEKMTSNHVIKRAGRAEECAMGIVFLIENDFVTGTTIDVDGGWVHAP